MIHTSGVLGAEALRPAMAAGTQAGAFHPLVAFADLDRALAALPGATVAIEGDEELAAHLAEMAEAIGAVPVRLPAGSKAAYHAAAVLAAGGTVALLDTIREIAGLIGPRRGGRPPDLPAAARAGRRQRPRPRHRRVAHRPGDPRRPGHDRRAPRGAAGGGARGRSPVYRALLERDAAIARGTRARCHRSLPRRLRAALAARPVTR